MYILRHAESNRKQPKMTKKKSPLKNLAKSDQKNLLDLKFPIDLDFDQKMLYLKK